MRVLYILNSTDNLGGATKSFKNMLYGLQAKGVVPTVVVPDMNGVAAELKEKGIDVLPLTFRPQTYTYLRVPIDYLLFIPRMIARFIVNHRAVKQLAAYAEQHKIDLVHTNVSIIGIGTDLAKKAGLPHIIHFREYADKDFDFHYFPTKRHFYSRLKRLKTYSICITKDIQRYHNLTEKSLVVYNGISPRQEKLSVPSKENYLLFVGRIEPAKGLLEVLQAYATYRKCVVDPLPLRVAGGVLDENYNREVQNFCKTNGIESFVEFLGQRSDVFCLMQKSRAIVIASRFEAFGRCMAEAMFAGCLVIGRDTGGTHEQFDNAREMLGHDVGLRYNTVEQLTQQLLIASSMPQEAYDSYVNDAFRVVNDLYTNEQNIERIFAFYNQILHTDSDGDN